MAGAGKLAFARYLTAAQGADQYQRRLHVDWAITFLINLTQLLLYM